MGVADTTIKRYLDILTGTFMVRQLLPFHANIAKRQAKKPKIYFRDTGVLHHLLGVKNHSTLQRSPKLGASWEGFALEQVIQLCNASSDKCYFWGVHQQAELDLLVEKDGGFQAFEFKDSPRGYFQKEACGASRGAPYLLSTSVSRDNIKSESLNTLPLPPPPFPLLLRGSAKSGTEVPHLPHLELDQILST